MIKLVRNTAATNWGLGAELPAGVHGQSPRWVRGLSSFEAECPFVFFVSKGSRKVLPLLIFGKVIKSHSQGKVLFNGVSPATCHVDHVQLPLNSDRYRYQ